MGVTGKWFKTLVGLRKSEKSKALEKDENVSNSLSIWKSIAPLCIGTNPCQSPHSCCPWMTACSNFQDPPKWCHGDIYIELPN